MCMGSIAYFNDEFTCEYDLRMEEVPEKAVEVPCCLCRYMVKVDAMANYMHHCK